MHKNETLQQRFSKNNCGKRTTHIAEQMLRSDQSQNQPKGHTWDSMGIAGPGSMAAKFIKDNQLSDQTWTLNILQETKFPLSHLFNQAGNTS